MFLQLQFLYVLDYAQHLYMFGVFFTILSIVFSVLSRFIITKAEEYFCGLSHVSYCYITGVHGTKSGFLVFRSSEKVISVMFLLKH